jgi:hypothetical protein
MKYGVRYAKWDEIALISETLLSRVCIKGAVAADPFYDAPRPIEAENLGQVFEKLNNGKRPPGFEKCRSLAVGDWVEDEDGVIWVCQPCGWTPKEDVEEA